MLGFIFRRAACIAVITYFAIISIITYFYDLKGLRKYPNFSTFSGITDLLYCYRSACGSQSRDSHEAHKEHPILRIGLNSISFGRTKAIKDIYGHGSKCIKDLNYKILKGTHTYLIDVIDKPDHARKRKLMSAAFAIKNFEGWEYRVALLTQRLVNAFDTRCTSPLPKGQVVVDSSDLMVDFNKWINLWTIEAINNITL